MTQQWPRRKPIRLRHYDYREAGAYFITICTREREPLFDDSRMREIASDAWRSLPEHHAGVEIDEFVLMPNHVHGILFLDGRHVDVGAQPAAPAVHVAPGSLGAVVRSYKVAVTGAAHASGPSFGASIWQRNYHDRIIRSDRALQAIRQYIIDNPARWAFDRYNPDGAVDAREQAFWMESA